MTNRYLYISSTNNLKRGVEKVESFVLKRELQNSSKKLA
jgi:hypothetical protein